MHKFFIKSRSNTAIIQAISHKRSLCKVKVHFCLHPTLSFVMYWISAQKACRQYLHAVCTAYTTYTLSALFALLLRLHSVLLFVMCWISAQKVCRQCMHFVCTAYTVSACAFAIGFIVCIVSTRELAFSVTADRKIYHARQKFLSEIPNFFSPYTGNPPSRSCACVSATVACSSCVGEFFICLHT